jgi:hypothetical protein
MMASFVAVLKIKMHHHYLYHIQPDGISKMRDDFEAKIFQELLEELK